MSNRFFAVCGAVFIDNKVMLVRHTYGNAKNRILLPGGYVKKGELPTDAIAREIFEETSVRAAADSVICIQFKADQWCVVFRMNYIEGTPQSDNHENSEVLLLPIEEAVKRPDLTNMSRAILNSVIADKDNKLDKGCYNSITLAPGSFEIFGI